MKILILVSVFFAVTTECLSFAAVAQTFAEPSFAQISKEAVLYSDEECSLPITTLPETYFVLLLSENEGVYEVSYKDISGYVLSAQCEKVDFEPLNKYAQASFTANNDLSSVNLRASPHKNSEILFRIPDGESGYYYGNAEGDALIEQVGKVWHYVKYDSGNQTYYGYVYSAQVETEPIPPCIVKAVEKEQAQPSKNINSQNYIIILSLCIPALVIMFVIFKSDRSSYSQS